MVQGLVNNVSIINDNLSNIVSLSGWAHAIEVTPTSNNPMHSPTNIKIFNNSISEVAGGNGDTFAFSVDSSGDYTADASQIVFVSNSLGALPIRNLDNKDILNATYNYWGTNESSVISLLAINSSYSSLTSSWGNVSYSPYFATPDMQLVSFVEQNLTMPSGNINVTVVFPANFAITGNSSWDGTLMSPAYVNTNASVPTSDFDSAALSSSQSHLGSFTIYEIGSPESSLTLSEPVSITFPGAASIPTGDNGYGIGYIYNSSFHPIPPCTSALNETNLPYYGDCYYVYGQNITVWTNHFTQFITYTTVANQNSEAFSSAGVGGGSGGGLGNTVASAAANTTAPNSTFTPANNTIPAGNSTAGNAAAGSNNGRTGITGAAIANIGKAATSPTGLIIIGIVVIVGLTVIITMSRKKAKVRVNEDYIKGKPMPKK